MSKPPPNEEEGLRYSDALMEHANRSGEVLRDLLTKKIDELKALARASKSLPQLQYLVEIYKLDRALGQEMLDDYVLNFAWVTDKPVGEQMRALRDAAVVISRKEPTKARLFQQDGSVEPVSVAARRLHDSLLSMRRVPQHARGLREVLRALVVEDMQKHAAWPLLEELAKLVGEELDVKLTENRLDTFFDIVHYRLLPHLSEDEASQQRAVELLTKLSAIEGSGIDFGKEEAVAEEPVEGAG